MKIGKNTIIHRISVTWPHQVSIGNNCLLEHDVYFKFDGIWQPGPCIELANNIFVGTGCEFNIRKKISIGDNTLIASGCKFIDHDHGTDTLKLMNQQPGIEQDIVIANNVWIGFNAIILKGVSIGEGAVIAAGSVVNKNVASYTMVAGVPAKIVKHLN